MGRLDAAAGSPPRDFEEVLAARIGSGAQPTADDWPNYLAGYRVEIRRQAAAVPSRDR